MWQKIRRLGLEIYCFFTAPFVVRNCLGMVTLVSLLFFMTIWWLKCYTNHSESLQVPSYVGINIREAVRKAKTRDFNVAISDSIYMPGKAPGEVLSQNPKPESRVKEGRTIYFTVAKSNPDIVRLPDIAGNDDYDMYSRLCSRMGLKTRISSRVAAPKLEPNTILDVLYRGDTITRRLSAGFSVEMGATIDFVVSDQVTLNVSIPDCVCQTFDAAKFLLSSSNLNLGTVIKDASVTDPEAAYVWKQTPRYDPEGKMRVGEQLDLFLTQDKPASCR
jgi:beta-lactam-binding protein with PASTA domain